MPPIKDTECRLQSGDVCCSLKFGDPALSKRCCGSTEYRIKTGVLGWDVSQKNKRRDVKRMEREECYKPEIMAETIEIGAYDQNRCLLSGAGAIRWSMWHTKTGSLACTRQIEHDAPNVAA